jgi:HAD superfamily hydrolase (TIGR01509 family)
MQATPGTSSSSPLQAVVFDMDGLMFNTEALYELTAQILLQRRGKTCTGDLLDAMMGRQPPIAIQTMIDWHALDDSVDDIAAETDEIFAKILDDRLATMPGLIELLDATESVGIPKAIATSSGRKFARSVLARFQLEPRFEFVLTAEDIVQGKPHPEIYLTAAAKLGLAPQQTLVLEDSETGCLAASAAGAFTVAVPDGQSQNHRFDGVQFIADTLADPRIYRALGLVASPALSDPPDRCQR